MAFDFIMALHHFAQEQFDGKSLCCDCRKTVQYTHELTWAWWLNCKFWGSQVLVPLQPPRRDLGKALHSQLSVALRRVNSDTVSLLYSRERLGVVVVVDLKRRYRHFRNEWMNVKFWGWTPTNQKRVGCKQLLGQDSLLACLSSNQSQRVNSSMALLRKSRFAD